MYDTIHSKARDDLVGGIRARSQEQVGGTCAENGGAAVWGEGGGGEEDSICSRPDGSLLHSEPTLPHHPETSRFFLQPQDGDTCGLM